MRKLATLSLVLVGAIAIQASAATVDIGIIAWTDGANGMDRMVAGDQVWFEVYVTVDPTGNGGNRGLASYVYDIQSPKAKANGYTLEPMTEALTGWDDGLMQQRTTKDLYYTGPDDSTRPTYGGGWGFDTAGLPTGGNVTTVVGNILGAGLVASPLGFTADTNALWPGNQPSSRLDVGVGMSTTGTDDPIIQPPIQLGHGASIKNGGIAGDGKWVLQVGHIDTSGWDKQKYDFILVLDSVSTKVWVGGIDYNQDQTFGDATVIADSTDDSAASFSFTLIPEPATLGLLLMGGLSLIRRRR